MEKKTLKELSEMTMNEQEHRRMMNFLIKRHGDAFPEYALALKWQRLEAEQIGALSSL